MKITLTSMGPDRRELMDKALTGYRKHSRQVRQLFPKYRPNVYSFAYWLFRYSGLVETKK